MMTLSLLTTTPEQTEALAAELAAYLPPKTIVLLTGDLGAGKTTFARALIRALAHNPTLQVASPTFNLVYSYETPTGPVAHFDLYRLKEPDEIEEIGFDEAGQGRAVIVEWPDRLGAREGRLRRAVSITLRLLEGRENDRQIDLDLSSVISIPRTAFIFAAGLGTRMQPLTTHTPKPLIPINGRPVLSIMLDLLEQVGVTNLVVNTHHLSGQVEEFLEPARARFDIRLSHEPVLLETGGGLRAALPLIDDDIFFVVNGDSPLMDGPGLPALLRLAATFDPARMDILLLLQPDRNMITPWVGDYNRAPDGRLQRALDRTGALMFTGIRIMHRRAMENGPSGSHSFLKQMDAAQAQGRLYGIEHLGDWHHLSTPEDVKTVTAHLQKMKT